MDVKPIMNLPTPSPHHERSISNSSSQPESHRCLWEDCTLIFPEANDLYEHITGTHIGRKSAGTLSLDCKWTGCTSKASKRDHLTSHVRVHINLKPHSCPVSTDRIFFFFFCFWVGLERKIFSYILTFSWTFFVSVYFYPYRLVTNLSKDLKI